MKTKLVIILFCAVLLAVVAGCAAPPKTDEPKTVQSGPEQKVRSLVNRAAACTRNSDWNGGIKYAGEALEMAPDDTGALLALGCAYTGKKDYEKSIETLDRLLSLSPKMQNGLYLRGLSFLETGKYDEAIADLSKLLSLYPGDSGAKLTRARAYLRKGDRAGASDDLKGLGHRMKKSIDKYPVLKYH